jgi:O-antigen/teichoic acid export membrane protein
LVFGQAFARAGILTLALLPSILILSLITVLSQYLSANGFPKFQVAVWFIGLVAQTGLSYTLVGEWGGLGVALAGAISNTLVFALLLIEALRMRNRAR